VHSLRCQRFVGTLSECGEHAHGLKQVAWRIAAAVREPDNPFAINGIGLPVENNVIRQHCVTVLNHLGDKKPSPQSASHPSPPALLRSLSISGLELSSSRDERHKAHKSRAFAVNNVLDLAEYISFFWHKSYEKNFLGPPENVLSSLVTSMKRFDL
jgi:hypothetical protein